MTAHVIETSRSDYTDVSGTEILLELAEFFGETYRKDRSLAGAVYLHHFGDNHTSGSEMNNLRMFKDLFGTELLESIILTMTMWSKVT